MLKRMLLVAAVAGCGGGVAFQTIKIVNRTDREIPEVYVYKMGATDHGKSVVSLKPGMTSEVKVPAGNVEVLAYSAQLQIDEHTRDRPEASQGLELNRPIELIFFDTGSRPPEAAGNPNVIGVEFRIARPAPSPPPE
jgi:hypothetical protein